MKEKRIRGLINGLISVLGTVIVITIIYIVAKGWPLTGVPETDNSDKILEGASGIFLLGEKVQDTIAGKAYVYEKDGFGSEFFININDDGTFTYTEGGLSSYFGMGEWTLDGDILCLSDDIPRTNYFKVEGEDLVFLSENSSNFLYLEVSDGERFLETAIEDVNNIPQKELAEAFINNRPAEPEILETDWSGYFDSLNGAAVVYNAADGKYAIYNKELALTRNSPCSTFKIISSLIALESGILNPEDSTRKWSGEVFWNENWNHDIDFREAFRTSCVWYFRELINEIGQEMMQEQLDKLSYGNCDISDWEGRLNTNNDNCALTGFWVESSLAISPKEQTEVMERIFGSNSVYSEDTQKELKEVMLVTEKDPTDISIYGKTGMGKVQGIVNDAWFTGFAESREEMVYFCVYLGKTDGKNVSSSVAKEIAFHVISDYFTNK